MAFLFVITRNTGKQRMDSAIEGITKELRVFLFSNWEKVTIPNTNRIGTGNMNKSQSIGMENKGLIAKRKATKISTVNINKLMLGLWFNCLRLMKRKMSENKIAGDHRNTIFKKSRIWLKLNRLYLSNGGKGETTGKKRRTISLKFCNTLENLRTLKTI